MHVLKKKDVSTFFPSTFAKGNVFLFTEMHENIIKLKKIFFNSTLFWKYRSRSRWMGKVNESIRTFAHHIDWLSILFTWRCSLPARYVIPETILSQVMKVLESLNIKHFNFYVKHPWRYVISSNQCVVIVILTQVYLCQVYAFSLYDEFPSWRIFAKSSYILNGSFNLMFQTPDMGEEFFTFYW